MSTCVRRPVAFSSLITSPTKLIGPGILSLRVPVQPQMLPASIICLDEMLLCLELHRRPLNRRSSIPAADEDDRVLIKHFTKIFHEPENDIGSYNMISIKNCFFTELKG